MAVVWEASQLIVRGWGWEDSRCPCSGPLQQTPKSWKINAGLFMPVVLLSLVGVEGQSCSNFLLSNHLSNTTYAKDVSKGSRLPAETIISAPYEAYN